MKITGHIAELSRREAGLFGCDNQELVSRLDCNFVLGRIATRWAEFAQRPSPFDAASAILCFYDGYRLQRDAEIAYTASGMVLAYEIEQFLRWKTDPRPYSEEDL